MSSRKKKSTKKSGIQNGSQSIPESKPAENIDVKEKIELFPKVYKILLILFLLVIAIIGLYFYGRNTSSPVNNESTSAENSNTTNDSTSEVKSSEEERLENENTESISNEAISDQKVVIPPTVDNSQSYNYIAVKGDSLHFLVRKSMLDYIRVNNISIDNNQKIYAETNIVKEFGVRRLNIGESIIIPQKLIAEWVLNSLSLTESEKMAWRPYANKVNYNL